MDLLNKIFNFVSLSYWSQRDRDGSGSESNGTGSGSYGSRMGAGLTTAGPGRDQEQRTSPVQNSSLCTNNLINNMAKVMHNLCIICKNCMHNCQQCCA